VPFILRVDYNWSLYWHHTFVYHCNAITLDLLCLWCTIECLHWALHIFIVAMSVFAQFCVSVVPFPSKRKEKNGLAPSKKWLSMSSYSQNKCDINEIYKCQTNVINWVNSILKWNLNITGGKNIINVTHLTASASSESSDTDTAGMSSSQIVSVSVRYTSTTLSNTSSLTCSCTSSLRAWTSA